MPDRTIHPLKLFDLHVGDEWTSQGRTITEADVVAFAGISGDFNPIHVDGDCASDSIFKERVAHGLLGVAIASGLASTCPRVDTMALVSIVDWKFLQPLRFGDTIHVVTQVVSIEPQAKGRRGLVTWRRQLFNQAKTLVQEGQSQTLVRGIVVISSEE